MAALDEYKRTSGRMFPTCSEVLEVLRNLGYQKLLENLTQTAETPNPDSIDADLTETAEIDSEATISVDGVDNEMAQTPELLTI
jgi:hypothetical protein